MDTASNMGEAKLRTEVAAATLLLNMEGILGYSGHVSVRLPGRDAFLIQPVDQSRAELEPDHLLVVDFEGGTLSGPEGAHPPSERFIHSEILKARPDVNAVAHFHPEIATLFTLVEDIPLRPMKNHAARWGSGIPVHPDPGHVNSPALGRALAQTLNGHQALLIRAHGAVLVAEDVPAILVDSVHFEENARALHRAASMGTPKPLTADEIESFQGRFNREKHVAKLWKYYLGRGYGAGVLPAEWAAML